MSVFLNDFFVKEKNAAITRFLRLRRICFYLKLLIEYVLERFAEFYVGSFASFDFDLLARQRINAVSFGFILDFESSKPRNMNVFAFFKRIRNRVYKRVEVSVRLFDCDPELVRIRSDKFTFVHVFSSETFYFRKHRESAVFPRKTRLFAHRPPAYAYYIIFSENFNPFEEIFLFFIKNSRFFPLFRRNAPHDIRQRGVLLDKINI